MLWFEFMFVLTWKLNSIFFSMPYDMKKFMKKLFSNIVTNLFINSFIYVKDYVPRMTFQGGKNAVRSCGFESVDGGVINKFCTQSEAMTQNFM